MCICDWTSAESVNLTKGDRIAEIVEAALGRDPAERAQFLEEACENDPGLRAEVESLLGFQEQARDFIEAPAYQIASGILSQDYGELKPGDILDNYKVLALLGEGGMGEVYLVQDITLGRRVAIKVVKRGLNSANILRRSREEEKILAGLNHPNIARLYGTGITPSGLPYFVMEYVDGRRLDQYSREEHLSIHDRLMLFRKICAAVAYAHQNLIIHRDIKPANIRVTSDGEPKLLDFGIAKLLDPKTATLAEMTITLAAVMTPEYASPEQVRGENMTTASDTYSAGVVLYELLTGQRPYAIKSRNPTEIARVISEQEPTRPSMAMVRNSTDSKFEIRDSKFLKGDLDNIVLKALRKEPARRYASVAQFSDDIRRYLDGRPVTARKDTLDYRAVKFIRRNKIAVAAAALVGLAIVTGVIAALWQAENARRQRDLAQRERLKAERINLFLQQMLSFSNQSVTSVWPVPQKKGVTVNEMLDQITPEIEAELSDEPQVRTQVLRTIGSAYASQGRYDLAEKNLRGALGVQIQLYGEDNAEVADTMSELGVLSYRQVKYEEASNLLERAVNIYRKLQQANAPRYSAARFALALDYLGATKFYQIDPYTGKPFMLEALKTSSTANLQGDDRRVLTFNKSDSGAAMVYTGDLDRGEALLREALDEYRKAPGRPPWEEGSTLTHLGTAMLKKHQFDDAQRYLLEGERVYREILGDENFYVCANLNRQAALLSEKNDLEAAEAKARESLAVARDFSPANNVLWAGPMTTLGNILIKSGRGRDGEDYLRQALAIYEHQPTKNYFNIGNLKIDLSQFLLSQDRLSEAEAFAVQAREDVRHNLGEQHPLMKSATTNLIAIYERQGKSDLANGLK
jgi:tRNA A-37 threonylcarbamoyl transferase component Bud32/tetratricopeptide (TPR) repeat protein